MNQIKGGNVQITINTSKGERTIIVCGCKQPEYGTPYISKVY